MFLILCAMITACSAQSVDDSSFAESAREISKSAVSADGVPIAFTEQGEGETALVFIHGGFCDQDFWSHQVKAFAGDYTVVTLDLAGHGKSGAGRGKWTLRAFGEDVKAVVEALDLDRLILIGHSMGGPVSLRAAQLMPERVLGVIGVDSLHDAEREWNEEAWKKRTESFRKDFKSACETMVRRAFWESADPELVNWVLEKISRARPEVGLPIFEMFSFYDMAAEMEKVMAPVRCVNGDLWPTNVEGNKRHAPGFEAVIIKDTGHFLMLERPDEFNKHLAETIRGITRERREGALDRILLSEKTDRAGPLIFDHRLHYGPQEEGGCGIACTECHHEYRGHGAEPPRACSECHLSFAHRAMSDLPSL